MYSSQISCLLAGIKGNDGKIVIVLLPNEGCESNTHLPFLRLETGIGSASEQVPGIPQMRKVRKAHFCEKRMLRDMRAL